MGNKRLVETDLLVKSLVELMRSPEAVTPDDHLSFYDLVEQLRRAVFQAEGAPVLFVIRISASMDMRSKVRMVKVLRQLTGLGLKAAKEVVCDNFPLVVRTSEAVDAIRMLMARNYGSDVVVAAESVEHGGFPEIEHHIL